MTEFTLYHKLGLVLNSVGLILSIDFGHVGDGVFGGVRYLDGLGDGLAKGAGEEHGLPLL